MKKVNFFLILLFALIACEKSPLFEEYSTFEGNWAIANTNEVTLSMGYFQWGGCKFKNKNLNNGNHACIGTIHLKGGILDILYKITEGNLIEFQSVSFNGSTDASKTNLPLRLFKGVWTYEVTAENRLLLVKKQSEEKTYLGYRLELQYKD